MQLLAPLLVTAEIRLLDVGPRVDRVWRLTRAVGEDGVRVARDLPWEHGRPVRVELTLPGDERAIHATGMIVAVAPDAEDEEGERARPRAIAFRGLDEDARRRLAGYVQERTLLS